MKIIAFNASPRNKGNTAWTIGQILESAQEHGAETMLWNAGDLDIKPCRGCLGCVQTDKCVVNDDMQELYREIEQADMIVLGTPVYMGQMNAQAKTFTDRLFAQITPRFSPRYKEKGSKKKQMVLVFTQGNPDPKMFHEYFDYTKKMFQLLEFDVRDVVVVTGTRNGPASNREDLQRSMKEIGVFMVSELPVE